ncbi:hypothetical protein O181_074991 [Austropuccinia psidii MF-1]|uniref:Uncharacterized protein n=1 Tax=Austropuccinia psidii MF-1 TaxID=1389203 RepID=A0A9Q3F7M9_9BASI|nr:hypothetical protein [Austropuccinia psidii MF-1]
MKHAESLRLSIKLYTATPEGSRYKLSDEIWSAIEFMQLILSLIEQSCNVFQSKAPAKHLVLPYYHVILKQLSHYEQVSPPTWHNACVAARSKLKKYYDYEMQNNDTLTATLLNPKYLKEIFKSLGVPAEQSCMIIEFLCQECSGLKAEKAKKDASLDRNSSPDYQSCLLLGWHISEVALCRRRQARKSGQYHQDASFHPQTLPSSKAQSAILRVRPCFTLVRWPFSQIRNHQISSQPTPKIIVADLFSSVVHQYG